MNYWPLSIIKDSPLMPPTYAWELSRVYATCQLSAAGFQACGAVARSTRPVQLSGLVIIETVNGPPRQAFTEYPGWDEWFRLERGGMVEADNGTLHVIIDALH